MDFRRVFLLIAACTMLPAFADFVTVEEAVETSTAWLKLPTSQNGRLSFKPCEECEDVVARLTPATRYAIGEEAVEFTAFRKEVTARRRGTEDYALVAIDLETNTVTRIEVAE